MDYRTSTCGYKPKICGFWSYLFRPIQAMAKIDCYLKRYTSSISFFIIFFVVCFIPVYSELPDWFFKGPRAGECGTLKDPNYRAAFEALQKAIELCFQGPLRTDSTRPYFFPKSSDSILDENENPVFYFEGSLIWEANGSTWANSSMDLYCRRILQMSMASDVPMEVYLDKGKHCYYPPKAAVTEELKLFSLYKDYASLLSVFNCLHDDAEFIYRNNLSFLQRRLKDHQRYYKPSAFYGCIPLRIDDLNKLMHFYSNQYKINVKCIEKCRDEATVFCKRSLDYCISCHNEPLAYINRGLFDYLDGNVVDALERLCTGLKIANSNELNEIKENALFLKGRSE